MKLSGYKRCKIPRKLFSDSLPDDLSVLDRLLRLHVVTSAAVIVVHRREEDQSVDLLLQ